MKRDLAITLLASLLLLSLTAVFPNNVKALSTQYSCQRGNLGRRTACLSIRTDCSDPNCSIPVPSSCLAIPIASCDTGQIFDCNCTSTPDPTAGCAFDEINTGIGCISVGTTDSFVEFSLKWGIGIGGGVALLLIAYAGIQMMTSAGNPEKVQAAKELMTAAIAGLLFLILSAFILRIISLDILGIPLGTRS